MPIGGAYIRYSELFDRMPSLADVEEIFAPLELAHAVLLLARINGHLRLGLQNRSRDNITWAQSFLISNFTDEETFRRLQERYPTQRLDERSVFHPLQVLNAVQIAFRVSSGSRRADTDPSLRHRVGNALLMINDLLVSETEQRAILTGTADERRANLMVQFVAPFEVMNPGQSWHLLFRSHVTYEELLQDTAITSKISKQCRGFDFRLQFTRSCGLELATWMNLAFAANAYYIGQNRDDLAANPGLAMIDRKLFIHGTGVGEQEFSRFLSTTSREISEFRSEWKSLTKTDPRFDLIPFQTKPLFVFSEGNFACVDPAFLISGLYTGPHWIIHDAIPELRNDLFTAWGILFQEYVNWLITGMERKPGHFLSFPAFTNGDESFDGLLLMDGVLVPMEYKGGFLNRTAKYSGDTQQFVDELKKKIGEGCRQLVSKIDSLFSLTPRKKRQLVSSLPLESITRILPVLVVQDHSLRTPLVNWWLNEYFQELISGLNLRPGLEVTSLNVINIDDFETRVESADAGPFDFIYSLRYRAFRDPQMLSEFHDFMLGLRGYAKFDSKRYHAYYESIQRRIFSHVFPRQ